MEFTCDSVNAKNLKLKASDAAPAIDWAAVDAAAKASVPDGDSPALTRVQVSGVCRACNSKWT